MHLTYTTLRKIRCAADASEVRSIPLAREAREQDVRKRHVEVGRSRYASRRPWLAAATELDVAFTNIQEWVPRDQFTVSAN